VARTGEAPAVAMPELTAEYHTAADETTRREAMALRRLEDHWANEGGRPLAPTLSEARQRHPFLTWDAAAERLSVESGDWTLEEALVLPEGMALYIGPGVRLAFAEGAALIATGPLLFEGSQGQPIVLESASPGASFDGVIVLDAGGE